MATARELLPPAVTAAPVGDQAVFAAVLHDADGHPLANLPLVFGVGPQNRLAVTDANGRAQASIPMMGLPGHYLVTVAFDGNDTYAAAAVTDESFFDILRQTAVLTLDPPVAQGTPGATGLITATLVDAAGRRLVEQTVFFEVRGNQNLTQPVITNMVGQATLGATELAPGTYTVVARYNGASSHAPTTSAASQLLLGDTIPTDEPPTSQPDQDRLFLPMTEQP